MEIDLPEPELFIHISSVLIGPDIVTLLFQLFILITLLFFSGLISGSEVAFFSLSNSEIKTVQKTQKGSVNKVLFLLQTPEKLLATILILNNLINVAIITFSAYFAWNLFGKSEFVVSLKTRSLEEAKIKKLQYLEAFTRAISAHLNFDIYQESTKENLATLVRDTLELNTLENQKEHQEINHSKEESRISVLLDMFLFEQRKILSTYTWQRKQKNIRKFIQSTGDINIASVSKNQFREFFDQAIMPYNLSRNTILGKLSDIGSIFNWALRRGYIHSNPVKGFASTLPLARKTSSRDDANQPLSRKMLFDLLCHIQEEDELFNTTILGIYTGMRIEEICRLKTTDIESECMLIREGKTQSAPRKIPIHKSILPLLATMIASTQDGYLIEGLKTYRGKRSHTISKRLGTRRKQLGFDRRKYTSILLELISLLNWIIRE